MELALIAFAALVGSTLTLFSGFGLGTMMTPVFALFFPVPLAIAATAVVHLACNLFKLGLLARGKIKDATVREPLKPLAPGAYEEIAAALKNVKAVAIMDKAESFSAQGGPLFAEVRAALYDLEPRPRTVGYVYGLGGRDITPAHFASVFARLEAIAAGGELGPVYSHLGQRG